LKELLWQVSLVTMSHPSPRTVAPPPCLPLYPKDSGKEVGRLLVKLAACKGWLLGGAACEAAAAGCCVSSGLRTETLAVMLEIRGNIRQCKPEGQNFKRD
jgi:hypothetical protein